MKYKKVMIIAVLVLLAVISFTKIAPWAADPETHRHSIEQTDEKIASVMTLSGGAAADVSCRRPRTSVQVHSGISACRPHRSVRCRAMTNWRSSEPFSPRHSRDGGNIFPSRMKSVQNTRQENH